MAIEIERRFLIKNDTWRQACLEEPLTIQQGYLARGDFFVLRIRVIDDYAKLTLKSKKTGNELYEYEYSIPVQDAREMLNTIEPRQRIEKKRYHCMHNGKLWEIDEFFGENTGLYVAEIELDHSNEAFSFPDWVGKEITDDEDFSNYALSLRPYARRQEEQVG